MSDFSKVNVATVDRARKPFDFSHTINTTSDFGHVQSLDCTYIPLAGTSVDYSLESLMRFSPLVAPSFGMIRKFLWSNFCPISKVFPHFPDFTAGTPVAMNVDGVVEPTVIDKLPYTTIYHLTWLCLLAGQAHYTVWSRQSVTESGQTFTFVAPVAFDNFNFDLIFGEILGNHSGTILASLEDQLNYQENPDYDPAHAEYAFSVDVYDEEHEEDLYYLVTFDFSNKRMKCLYKHFITCGYKFTFGSNDAYDVNVLSLLATAKVIFDNQNVAMYDNYKDTPMYKLYLHYQSHLPRGMYALFKDLPDLDESQETQLFLEILRYLSETYFVEDLNFVSAHTALGSNGGANPNLFSMLSLPDVGSNNQSFARVSARFDTVNSTDDTATPNVSGNPFELNSSTFSQLDDEMLKILYYRYNSNAQIGFKIREQLVSRGFAMFCDEIDSVNLHYSSEEIQIETVTSLASTDDASLGEFGGRAQNYSNGNIIHFENKEPGFLITTLAICPVGDFCGASKVNFATIREEMYTPELDGLGFEPSPMSILGKNDQFVDPTYNGDATTYGYIPRYTGFKTKSSTVNGDMLRHKYQDTYLPYQLNKFLTPTRSLCTPYQHGISEGYKFSVAYQNYLPIASKAMREPTRYSWLGNYNRIFRDFNIGQLWTTSEEIDNIVVHCYMSMHLWSRMLPVADSFDTQCDEGNENIISVSKDN